MEKPIIIANNNGDPWETIVFGGGEGVHEYLGNEYKI